MAIIKQTIETSPLEGTCGEVITYKGIDEGDFCRCTQCGKLMLLPYGADQCPECCGYGTLDWADDAIQETNDAELKAIGYKLKDSGKKLKLEDYLDVETLAIEYPDYYRKIHDPNY